MTDAHAGYPPEPWFLGGSLLVSVFLVPRSALPASWGASLGGALPPRRRALGFGGRVIVGVAAAQYLPGGVLDYEELLVAVPSLGRGGLRVTIPQIWVDSPTSMRGGRELWGIPKRLAAFRRAERMRGAGRAHPLTEFSMAVDSRADDSTSTAAHAHGPGPGAPAVELRARRTAGLPGVWPIPLPTLQVLDGRTTLARNRVIARVSALRASWRFAADGPLGYLHGRRPVLNLALHDAAIVFGTDVTRS
ncbi:acetoacetate decarboxylase family protein [Herbiconiux sp. 11R-BC]|uniref:acetoacetate decarboxylase family protein n=1 Tax=Herbiconiux sp. 11R-BC TaxID=3111637 RepID=UPI003C110AF2